MNAARREGHRVIGRLLCIPGAPLHVVLAALLFCAPATLIASAAQAQAVPTASVRLELASVRHPHFTRSDSRAGIAVAAGTRGDNMILRLVGGYYPQGDVKPGWSVLQVEAEPRFVIDGVLAAGVRAAVGGHYMDVRNRRRVNANCGEVVFCTIEGPPYVQGWSSAGQIGAAVSLRITDGVDLATSVATGRLFFGANAEHAFRSAGIGFEYRFDP